jgi:hypothetical protein
MNDVQCRGWGIKECSDVECPKLLMYVLLISVMSVSCWILVPYIMLIS